MQTNVMQKQQLLEALAISTLPFAIKRVALYGLFVGCTICMRVAAGSPRSTLLFEQQNRKPFVGIGKVRDRAKAKKPELFLKTDWIEFSTDLDKDFLIFSPAK